MLAHGAPLAAERRAPFKTACRRAPIDAVRFVLQTRTDYARGRSAAVGMCRASPARKRLMCSAASVVGGCCSVQRTLAVVHRSRNTAAATARPVTARALYSMPLVVIRRSSSLTCLIVCTTQAVKAKNDDASAAAKWKDWVPSFVLSTALG